MFKDVLYCNEVLQWEVHRCQKVVFRSVGTEKALDLGVEIRLNSSVVSTTAAAARGEE